MLFTFKPKTFIFVILKVIDMTSLGTFYYCYTLKQTHVCCPKWSHIKRLGKVWKFEILPEIQTPQSLKWLELLQWDMRYIKIIFKSATIIVVKFFLLIHICDKVRIQS